MVAGSMQYPMLSLLTSGAFTGAAEAAELGRRALIVAMELALPVLAVGLAVGLLVSLVQAMTQIQEQTLSFIPKILAMAGTLFLLLPWIVSVMMTYMQEAFQRLALLATP
jgi:flagellar biosynthetic protein FliQ